MAACRLLGSFGARPWSGLFTCRRKFAVCISVRVHSGRAEDKHTHFGFESVPESEKAEKVYRVFKNVAKNYDIMNDAMSLGIHRLWKDALIRMMNPLPGTKLLDVAGGTGDIAFRFMDYLRLQHERQSRQAMKSCQSPSWQQISDFYEQQNKSDSDLGSKAVICDINKEMLKVGKQKAEQLNYTEGLSWVVGNAEELPFDDDKFDVYTIAFGIRNVTHIDH
ncbi:hypothetical protein scyTo_0021409, partial [Scyliorhinus torazame]|nr:hypothetical protein [Scyliorhinus torazame]